LPDDDETVLETIADGSQHHRERIDSGRCRGSSKDSRTASETDSQEATEAEGKGGQDSEAMTVSPLLLFRALDW